MDGDGGCAPAPRIVYHRGELDERHIEILSDSTGETAEKVVRAAMLQFPHSGSQVRLHTRIRTKDAARPILEAA
ncbi:MAG: kinase/pyrophosphorylase, partial [Polyangiaceae bacterium]